MSTAVVAGVDSSTQSCKVELREVDSGELLSTGTAPHPPAAPPSSEQDPQQWWTAFVGAFRQVKADAEKRAGNVLDVRTISVAGQCHGLVALNAAGKVIRPAKLWNDTTSTPELRELQSQIGGLELIRRSGSLPTAAFTLSKIAWLARHEPANFAALSFVLLPHDYLTFRLSGEMVTDRSEASGTGYFNSATDTYIPEFLQLIDAEKNWPRMLPVVLGPEQSAGAVLPGAAAELGISSSTIVGAGGGDQHAAALGLGLEPGDVVYSFGTSGVVFTSTSKRVYDPEGMVNGVADMNNGYLPLVCTLNAAKVTDTFARILGVEHSALSTLALNAPDNDSGPVLAAFLDGERTPDRPAASGILADISTSTTREEVARAAYEGVIFGLVNGQRRIERCDVDTSGRVLAVGGGARSPAYTQLLAGALNRQVRTADAPEATARGASVQTSAVARGLTVVEVRRQWKPDSTVIAAPRDTGRNPWPRYAAAASQTGLDRPDDWLGQRV